MRSSEHSPSNSDLCDSSCCNNHGGLLPPWGREEPCWLEEGPFLHEGSALVEGNSQQQIHLGHQLNSLSPQESFDPDLDEVDEKFIDSLLNSTPLLGAPESSLTPHSEATAYSHIPSSQPQAFWPHQLAAPQIPYSGGVFNESGSNSSSSGGGGNNTSNGILSNSSGNNTNNVSPSNGSSSSSSNTSASSSVVLGPLKKAPQFRWRRRKRRSKAQYPEMSRYLSPIDSGEEVQHLGRTLECTLCGLRGKRCHLTLHFKAKHAEVIEFDKKKQTEQGGNANPLASSHREEEFLGAASNINNNNNNSPSANGVPSSKAAHLHHHSVKIFELEEALGKAFLFLKDTLEEGKEGELSHPSPLTPHQLNPPQQMHLLHHHHHHSTSHNTLEMACMNKMNNRKGSEETDEELL